MQRIVLTEYQPRSFTRHDLSDTLGELIYRRWSSKVDVEFPSPKTRDLWRITPGGWVGILPLTPDTCLDLQPKVPIANLLRMFEFAYGLRSVEFMKDIAGCSTLDDFYSKLAAILAVRVLHRARRGLYRGYVSSAEPLGAVRGRIDVRRHISRPWSAMVDCEFEEHTADLVENRILSWTLSRIVQSPSLAAPARPLIRAAWRATSNATTPQQIHARDCIDRLYNRLNDDYEQLHLLCRFFLEHTGPTASDGDAQTVPFVVNMARLFELFVAEWLRARLPPRYVLRWQDRATLGTGDLLQFSIDMVLHDRETGRDVAVIDAKYKRHDRPSNKDVAQVTLYAQLRDCQDAILIYPARPPYLFEARTPQHRIRTLWFDLDADTEASGQVLLRMILA